MAYTNHNYPYSSAPILTGSPVFRYTYLDFTEGMYYTNPSNVKRSLNGLWNGSTNYGGTGSGPLIFSPKFNGTTTSYLSSADSVYTYPNIPLTSTGSSLAGPYALSNSHKQVTNVTNFNAYINYRSPMNKSPGGTDITISRAVVTTVYSRYDYNFSLNTP